MVPGCQHRLSVQGLFPPSPWPWPPYPWPLPCMQGDPKEKIIFCSPDFSGRGHVFRVWWDKSQVWWITRNSQTKTWKNRIFRWAYVCLLVFFLTMLGEKLNSKAGLERDLESARAAVCRFFTDLANFFRWRKWRKWPWKIQGQIWVLVQDNTPMIYSKLRGTLVWPSSFSLNHHVRPSYPYWNFGTYCTTICPKRSWGLGRCWTRTKNSTSLGQSKDWFHWCVSWLNQK